MKKILITAIILLIGIWLIILLFTSFEMNCRGDICMGPKILVHTLATNKFFCSIVGGNYNTEIISMKQNNIGCYITNKLFCKLKGGELKDQNFGRSGAFILPEPSFYCGKD
ncbi:MAG TPA: hypothetical protein DEB09_03955 [Candidatus Magasanikbacteria bacterium]|nr:hypothetical protein [Candidatus Magasanikbacteria bacterium]